MLLCSLCCMHKYEMVIIPLIMVLTYLLQIGVLFLRTAYAAFWRILFTKWVFAACYIVFQFGFVYIMYNVLHMIFSKLYYGLFHAYVFLGTSHIISGGFHIHFLRIMLQNKRWSWLASSPLSRGNAEHSRESSMLCS